MQKLFVRAGSMIVAAVALAGCLSPKTEGTSTKDIIAQFQVTYYSSGSNGVSCTASFYNKSDGQRATMNAADVLTCNGELMLEDPNSGTYYASVDWAQNKTYQISLIRSAESVYISNVTLPDVPVPSSPLPPTIVARGSQRTFYWTASADPNDQVYLSVTNNLGGSSRVYCYRTNGPGETGAITFTGSELQSPTPVGGLQSGWVYYSRIRNGTMPSGLSGTITATRSYTYTISLG